MTDTMIWFLGTKNPAWSYLLYHSFWGWVPIYQLHWLSPGYQGFEHGGWLLWKVMMNHEVLGFILKQDHPRYSNERCSIDAHATSAGPSDRFRNLMILPSLLLRCGTLFVLFVSSVYFLHRPYCRLVCGWWRVQQRSWTARNGRRHCMRQLRSFSSVAFESSLASWNTCWLQIETQKSVQE